MEKLLGEVTKEQLIDDFKVVVADAMGSHLDHFQRFGVSPCSITVIAYSHAGPHILCVNSTEELPGT